MSFDYTEVAALADELLQEFGQAVTITTRAAGAYDPATGAASVTETTQAGTGALFDIIALRGGEQNADGSAVLTTDKQLLLSPYTTGGAAITPPVADSTRVLVDGDTYTVKVVREVSPAGTPVMYDCNVRK